ncbi:hypothetical protein P9139_09465 [Curtobacterium flaccumfaciens]|nr:hypothetical protein P9139_09465 [Curtobacterium flaccumfaciens]
MSAAGTSFVATARSITETADRSTSNGVRDGRPASVTKLVGSWWIAATARPTLVASSGRSTSARSVGCEPGR